MGGGEPPVGYAFCVDDDLLSFYIAGYTVSDIPSFAKDSYRYLPAEWPQECYAKPINNASYFLGWWVGSLYEQEEGRIGVGNDHLRSWKADVVADIVSILANHRAAGKFTDDMTVLFTSHDPGDWMAEKVKDAVRRLNSPAIYGEWKREVYDGWLNSRLLWQEARSKWQRDGY